MPKTFPSEAYPGQPVCWALQKSSSVLVSISLSDFYEWRVMRSYSFQVYIVLFHSEMIKFL